MYDPIPYHIGELRYLLLMRHASPSEKAEAQVSDVGKGLANLLQQSKLVGMERRLTLGFCVHAATPEASRTAEILEKTLRAHGIRLVRLSDASGYRSSGCNPGTLLHPERCKDASPYLGRFDKKAAASQREQSAFLRALIKIPLPLRTEEAAAQGEQFARLRALRNFLLPFRTKSLPGEKQEVPNAILVVGHSPQLGWLVRRLTRAIWFKRPLPRYDYALTPSEIVCIEFESPPQVGNEKSLSRARGKPIWTLAPTDEETGQPLREKIKAKMESAKLLGGVIGAALTFVLSGFKDLVPSPPAIDVLLQGLHLVPVSEKLLLPWERTAAFGAAAVALLFATGLYFSAYLSYDRLLMPKRFWAEAKPPTRRRTGIAWRPPSSDLLVSHQNMQRVWHREFIPAIVATILGLVGLTYAAIVQALAHEFGNAWRARACFLITAGLLLLVLFGWHRSARPLIGTQD